MRTRTQEHIKSIAASVKELVTQADILGELADELTDECQCALESGLPAAELRQLAADLAANAHEATIQLSPAVDDLRRRQLKLVAAA